MLEVEKTAILKYIIKDSNCHKDNFKKVDSRVVNNKNVISMELKNENR